VAIPDNEARPFLRNCLSLQMRLVNQPHPPQGLDLPQDSATLFYLIATALETGSLEKQGLLEIPDVERRLKEEVPLLKQENLRLKQRLDERPQGEETWV